MRTTIAQRRQLRRSRRVSRTHRLILGACALVSVGLLRGAEDAEAAGVRFHDAICATNPAAVVENGAADSGLAVSGAVDCPLDPAPAASVADPGGLAVGSDRDNPTTTQGLGESIAIGNGASAGFDDPLDPSLSTGAATAIGVDALALGNNAVALGTNANANGEASVAVGFNTSSQNQNDISMGNSALASGGNAIGLGFDATAQGNQSTALGSLATASNQLATAVGANARATGQSSLALGASSFSNSQNTIAIGVNATANQISSIALGENSQGNNQEAIAIGARTLVSGIHGVALGSGSQATNQDSVAIGVNVVAGGLNSIAIGTGARAAGQQSISIGAGNVVTALNAGAFGDPNTVSGGGSYAFGNNNQINAENAFALGNNIVIANGLNGAVGIGNSTTVAAAIGTSGIIIDGITYNFAGASPQSTVSIGASGSERTLTNLAAGRISGVSTDAVNGSQLFALSQAVDAIEGTVDNAVIYDDASDSIVTLGGADGTLLTNVAPGEIAADSTDAVNGAQLFATNEAIDVLDADVQELFDFSVFYDDTSFDTVTFDGAAGTLLTNVAPGTLSSDSTDAVNGAQLFAASEAIDLLDADVQELFDFSVFYDNTSFDTVTFGGTSGTVLTNLAPGAVAPDSTDAVNGGQLNDAVVDLEAQIAAAGQSGFVTDDGASPPTATGLNASAGGAGATASGEESLALGSGAEASGVQSISIGAGSIVSGDHSGAFGDPNIVSGSGSYAFGNDNTINASNAFILGNNVTIGAGLDGAVALGNGTTVDAAVATPSILLNGTTYAFAGAAPQSTVSIGAAGQERTLTNVAAGQVSATSTHAVNGSQLYATNQALELLAAGVTDLSDLAVVYDDGTQAAITLAESGTTITNVAAGAVSSASSDAVNGAQLYASASSSAAAFGGGATVNADGSISAPSYTVQGATHDNVGDAIAAIDTQVNANTAAIENITNDIESGGIGLVQQASRGADLTVGAETDGARVNFTGTAGARVLTGVAAGAVAANSSDAVNGAQLDQAIKDLEAQISADGSEAFVSNASSTDDEPVATGAGASAGGVNAVASGQASLALGNGAQASGAQSVALGAGSSDDGAANVVSVGSTNNERRIIHVADGVDATDAVNVNQLNTAFDRAVSNAYAYTDERVAAVSADVNTLRRDSEAGTAAAMALTGIPQSYRPGSSLVGIGVGSWQGESAIAFGASRSTSDGRVVLRIGGTYNTRSQGGVSAGVGVSF